MGPDTALPPIYGEGRLSKFVPAQIRAPVAHLASQRIGVDNDPLDGKWRRGSTLLVDGDGLNLGQRGQRVVAYELAKDGIEPIQMRRLVKRDEELRAIRAGPLVGHGDGAARIVTQGRADLVVKGAAPDGLAALWVFGRRVRGAAGLDHEFGDEAVEGRLIVISGGA